MTNSRIASALLAPALAAILAVACSSSDNNGGGTTVGGNGGTSGTTAKGGSGPSVVTSDVACVEAYDKGISCGKEDPGRDQFLADCKKLPAGCAKCISTAECDKLDDCAEACTPTSGGEGGASSGKGGSSSGKGGSSSGSGGGGSTDPEECLSNCDAENPDGVDSLNTFFVESCGCASGAACATECTASCAAKQVDEACGTCLQNLGQGDACVNDVITACQGDKACSDTLTCYTGCQGSGGGGGSGGGSGQACADECAKNNQAGVAAYNADAQNLKTCLCTGAECKDTCGASPICTNGMPQASQECINCQDNCFSGCLADTDCKKLYDCVQGCN